MPLQSTQYTAPKVYTVNYANSLHNTLCHCSLHSTLHQKSTQWITLIVYTVHCATAVSTVHCTNSLHSEIRQQSTQYTVPLQSINRTLRHQCTQYTVPLQSTQPGCTDVTACDFVVLQKQLLDNQCYNFCRKKHIEGGEVRLQFLEPQYISLLHQLMVSLQQRKSSTRHQESQIRPHNWPQWVMVSGSGHFLTREHVVQLMKAQVSHLL